MFRRARERRAGGRATIFFLDEIHRFNKAQQDALLPAVEEGLVTLVGATTENPYFEVNSALLSRTQVYELHALSAEHVEVLLRRALERGECGEATVGDEVIEFLAARSGGDARTALNALELACETSGEVARGRRGRDAAQGRALRQGRRPALRLDSAWIKATRGSDPDGSLYYLAAMLGRRGARFIARRMVILASEDIGNADPQALGVAVAAAHAVEHVGMPECGVRARPAAIYSRSRQVRRRQARHLRGARAHRQQDAAPPPAPLRSAAYPAARKLGRGWTTTTRTATRHVNDQEHLPAGREDLRFYDPDDAEAGLRERLAGSGRRARGSD